jgi:hypothetical protein
MKRRQVSNTPQGSQKTSVTDDPIERSLREIQELWDKSFAEHMTEKGNRAFPASLQEIRNRYKQKDYRGAAQIAEGVYKEAAHKSDYCEGTGPGFAYFQMVHAFESLTGLLKCLR